MSSLSFKLDFLDHVAIRVRDMERSAAWYEKVLGLKRVQYDVWGPFPIMMMAGNTGIAIFPSKTDHPETLPAGDWLVVPHFAFRVDAKAFAEAQNHFHSLDIPFEFQDHYYFHSIYLTDPDDYRVELTTLVRDIESSPE